jgi:hypothetical protein
MALHKISVSANIGAPAEKVYAILADYREGHPRILPRPPFLILEVEQGGYGEGTVVRCSMRLMGRTRTFRTAISEPEPGRILVETDLSSGFVTTFLVDPCEQGKHCRVTISTELKTRNGLLGKLEGTLTTRFLRPTYVRELDSLAALAEAQ